MYLQQMILFDDFTLYKIAFMLRPYYDLRNTKLYFQSNYDCAKT